MRSTGGKAVALTFDDGPDPVNTPKILDLLKMYGVKATFCLIGFRVRDDHASGRDLVKRMVAEGHTLCNHSWQHLLNLAALKADKKTPVHTDAFIRKDLKQTNDAILAEVPTAKIQYFRAPGGNFTTRLVDIAASMGMKSIYWAVDPRDWDSATFGTGASMVKHVISAVQHDTGPGAIVLSHDNGKPDTITAYKTLLPWLKTRFTLIPLPLK